MDTTTDRNTVLMKHAIWEDKIRSELKPLYKLFFENNQSIKITYEEFVVYCYNHTSFLNKLSKWQR